MLKYALISLFVSFSLLASPQVPTDTALVKGELANGMKYIIQKNAKPPGKASIWLHVSSGSLDEDENPIGFGAFFRAYGF